MILLVLLEFFIGERHNFSLNDTVTSVNAGIMSLLFKIGGKSLAMWLYPFFYQKFNIINLDPTSSSTWILCLFTQDLAYYLAHRAIHEFGIFWSFHQMHHSSEYYNLSTALRQGCIQDIGTCIFDLSQCLFIPPNIFVVHRGLNVAYQFWLHTELVPYLGPLEYFLNTPSSHRVHHGRNPYCIDRNYGGTLIIWDRLFGTYTKEREGEEIAYGLVTNINTFDQLYAQFFEFWELGWVKPNMVDDEGKELFPGFLNKLKTVFAPPGYFPGTKTKDFLFWKCMKDSEEGIPEIEYPVVRHDVPLTLPLRAYLTVRWLIFIAVAIEFNEARNNLQWSTFFIQFGAIVAYAQTFGYYFDRRNFAFLFDLVLTVSVFASALFVGSSFWITMCSISLLTVIPLKHFGLF